MKLKTRLIYSLVMLFAFSISISAQDIIIKKDGKKIKAKIIELNDTQVKYYEFRDINNLIFSMDRALIKEIRFETGTKYKEEQPGNSDLYYSEDRINNLKLNFISIGSGDLILTYERALNAGTSYETTLKIYGLGDGNSARVESGFGLNLGYKFKLGNLFKRSGEYRPRHILHGGYFRPVLGYSYSKSNQDFGFGFGGFIETDSYVQFGLDLGKQWIVQNSASLEFYLGFHYYAGSFKSSDPDADRFPRISTVEDGDLFGASNRALAVGLRVGGLFTKRGIKKSK